MSLMFSVVLVAWNCYCRVRVAVSRIAGVQCDFALCRRVSAGGFSLSAELVFLCVDLD